MITANSIDKKIVTLLTGLNIQQKKAVLTVVKTFAQEKADEWQEEEYMKEMNSRFTDYETGKVKGHTIQETINAAKKAYKSRQNK